MQQGSRIKPVVARAEGWFAVFGRIGVMPGLAGSNHKGNGAEKETMLYVNAHVLYQRKILPRPFWLLFAETKPLLNSVQKLLFQQRVDEYIHQFTAMTLSFSYSKLKQRPLDEIYTCIRNNQMTPPQYGEMRRFQHRLLRQ
ncbi:TPA: hypothetical protein KL738_004594 [Escherichia coli]|nr:hypothetical protein [Escherichia coli]